jgi:para-aminobenzoate synthetase/4-amino-4-deoxychorismate lyase
MINQVVIQDASQRRWLRFQNPVQTIATTRLEDVRLKLEQVESAVNKWGLHAAGFLSYEAAPAFDAALRVRQAGSVPLLWFGLYERPEEIDPPFTDSLPADKSYQLGVWRPSVKKEAYNEAIDRIKMYIEAAYTYQVNYTFRLRADFHGQPWPFFVDLAQAQQAEYAAFLDIGTHTICSASPELFFKLDGSKLSSKPMKGTIGRGRTLVEDQELADWLYHSEKNRAENVMIVDMIRNDIGRVGIIGSVEVPYLFEVEKYPTVWQMTSTITSSTEVPLSEIMAALFPCASITGAPKVSHPDSRRR